MNKQEVCGWLIELAQLLDGWHNDGTAWSEWDESVRKRLTEYHLSLPCETGKDSQELAALKEILAFHFPGTGQSKGPSFTDADIERWRNIAGMGLVERPEPQATVERVQPEPLNELDKNEWWDVVQTCQPQISRQEFELMWSKFQALKEKRIKQ